MSITSAQYTLTTTAQLIHQADADGCLITIANHAGTGSHAYLGAADVSSSTGHLIDGKQSISLVLTPGTAVYGITDSGTTLVSKIVSN